METAEEQARFILRILGQPETFGQALKAMRKTQWTRQSFARLLDISRDKLDNFETGKLLATTMEAREFAIKAGFPTKTLVRLANQDRERARGKAHP